MVLKRIIEAVTLSLKVSHICSHRMSTRCLETELPQPRLSHGHSGPDVIIGFAEQNTFASSNIIYNYLAISPCHYLQDLIVFIFLMMIRARNLIYRWPATVFWLLYRSRLSRYTEQRESLHQFIWVSSMSSC